jgi:ATP/maltotriose-dependent transcriptional regulator MalT
MGERTTLPEQSLLASAQDALENGRWEEARDAFRAALDVRETAEAHEGLGTALEVLEDIPAAIESRERAYRAYRERGDDDGAARAAIALALNVMDFRGDLAVVRGWLELARRLLENVRPSFEHAFLAGVEAHVLLFRENDPERAGTLAAEAHAIARAIGDVDIEMLSVALQGVAAVTQGDIRAGMAMIDEASAAVTAGEVRNAVLVTLLLCYVIAACERVRDFDRAGQWCERLAALSQRWSLPSMLASCRTQYAGVLMARGTWSEAERELETATGDLRAIRPAMAGDGLVRLAELRRRQGRSDESLDLCGEAEHAPYRLQAYPHLLLVRAEVALDAGDGATAADTAERFLRAVPAADRTARAGGLELLARALAAAGRAEQAGTPAGELAGVADVMGTPPLRASARFAAGVVARSHGEVDEARRALEDAVDLFADAHLPYEEARARAELAAVLNASDRAERAEQEAHLAREAFLALGATQDAVRLSERFGFEGSPAASNPAGLSPRELDVLKLVARGRSNREIAEELFLSVRTVERHVTNIYAKLGATGKVARALATGYAHRNAIA